MTASVHVSRHPLLLHRLAQLRDKSTGSRAFRQLVREMSQMLFFEATQDLHLSNYVVQTPLTDCAGQRLADTLGVRLALASPAERKSQSSRTHAWFPVAGSVITQLLA